MPAKMYKNLTISQKAPSVKKMSNTFEFSILDCVSLDHHLRIDLTNTVAQNSRFSICGVSFVQLTANSGPCILSGGPSNTHEMSHFGHFLTMMKTISDVVLECGVSQLLLAVRFLQTDAIFLPQLLQLLPVVLL